MCASALRTRLIEQLKADPTPVAEQLRAAWSAVSATTSADCQRTDTEALARLENIAKNIYQAIASCQVKEEHKLSLDGWSRVYDSGLPDLIHDIVMDDRFFALPNHLAVGYVFDSLLRISIPSDEWARLYGTRVLLRSNALWASLWDNRDRIVIQTPNRPPNDTGEQPVCQALMTHHLLHRYTKSTVSWSSHMHHYALYAWATAKAPTGDFNYVSLCETGLRGPGYSPTVFIREAIIDGVGVDACFSRLAAILRSDPPWRWDHIDHLRSALSLFGGLILHGEEDESLILVESAGRYRIPQLAVNIARGHTLTGGLRASPAFYNGVFSILMKSTQYDCVTNWKGERASTPLVPGEDVMAILACAIDLLALHGTETDLEKNARTTMVGVVNFLWSVLRMYFDRVKGIKDVHSGDVVPLQSEILAGLKRGAAEYWWPSLRRIEVAKRRCDSQNENIVQYCTLWKGFGALLGCDAKRERQKDAREAAGRCTRSICEYHSKPPKKQLLRCKGCGVYYCSRDCQVADWKSGHKKECRRLDTADTSA